MSVALKKVDGIDSVNVTLKRGVAHLTLKPGNTVTLTQLRGIIKDAGYTTNDAVVTVRGTAVRRGPELVFEVSGTPERLQIVPDRTTPEAVNRLRDLVAESRARAELSGTVPAPAKPGAAQSLRLRSFTIDP